MGAKRASNPVCGRGSRQSFTETVRQASLHVEELERFALELSKFRDNPGLLQTRQIFHENPPLEMIHLMLNADREQSFRIQLERTTFPVQSSDSDALSPLNLVIDARHRKATLLELRRAALGNDLRIDQHEELITRLRDVDHDDSLVHVQLRGGQADAGSRVHGLRQIADERPDLFGNFADRLGDVVQSIVGVLQNRTNCHLVSTDHAGNFQPYTPPIVSGLARKKLPQVSKASNASKELE